MGITKKIILGIVLLAGVLGLYSDFRQYGEMAGMLLAIEYMITTVFLWNWASGHFPKVGKLHAILILLASGLITLTIVNWALAGEFHVDLAEVVGMTLRHKPIYYAAVLMVAFLKVFFWRWLFSGVREEKEEAATAA